MSNAASDGTSPSGCDEGDALHFLALHPAIDRFDLVVTDGSGVARGKRVRREELLRIFRGGRAIAGSVLGLDITGADVEEAGLLWEDGDADRMAWPIPGTLAPAPWHAAPTGQVLASMYELDGRPMASDPRHALAAVVERFRALGLTPVVAIELEFYLLDREAAVAGLPRPPKGIATGQRPQHMQAYSLSDVDDFERLLDDVYDACDAQGLPAEAVLAEYSPGQFEMVLRHRADAMRAADEAIMFKRVVKGVAGRHGMDATFMAKPYAALTGSGMHVHVSFAGADGSNVFASDSPLGAPLLRQALAGMLETLPECVGILAPNANSYRRFRRHSYAPVKQNWGVNNRTVALRVTAGEPQSRHIEHRLAGADANPYLALAVALAGAHLGIARELDPGEPVQGSGYDADAPELPTNWYEALHRTADSEFLREYLGERFMRTYTAVKRAEQDRFNAEVTALDHLWYLRNA